MDELLVGILISILAGGFGSFAGWSSAHGTVATECKRLGAFYVGDKVYECKERK